MKYLVETSLENFHAWSGGKDTLETLKEFDDCSSVEMFIDELYADAEEPPTDTTINDFLWFERDLIASHLGYENWEKYEYHHDEVDEEDDEEELVDREDEDE